MIKNIKHVREVLKSFGLGWNRVYTEKRAKGYRCKLYVTNYLETDIDLKQIHDIANLKLKAEINIQKSSQKYAKFNHDIIIRCY